jgi:hypothetical protein
MRLFTTVVAGTTLLCVAAVSAEPLVRSDRQGPVAVTLTLLAPPAAGTPLGVRLVLDTHTVSLDGVRIDRAVALRTAGGDIAPTRVEASGGGHHREAVLSFPPPQPDQPIVLVVKDVGGVPERLFTWAADSR